MYDISVTSGVFQFFIFALNCEAPSNMCDMSVTACVFQALISSLNCEAP
jgi:hypothetical protein